MTKTPIKNQRKTNNPLISPNQAPKLDSSLSKKKNKITLKPKQQIDKDYYQKNKERKKQQRRERYQQQKKQEQLITKQIQAKYYGAEAIKVLMTFKEYTELNQDKMKLWTDFNWTLKDCQENIKEGLGDIVAIMKLEQVAGNLVRDYWDTAKGKIKENKRSWNNLDYDEQQKLIRYWGYEKARIENNYLEEQERLEKQSKSYLKQLEIAKFHEQRGKIKCSCGWCEQEAIIKGEVKAKIKKEIAKAGKEFDDSWGVSDTNEKGECYECGEYKKVDSDSGLCRKCDADGES